jgi:hypothetical protein
MANTSWTPTDQSGAGLTFSSVTAIYTSLTNIVHFTFTLTYPSTASSSNVSIGFLPNPSNQTNLFVAFITNGTTPIVARVNAGQSYINFFNTTTGAQLTNTNLSAKIIQVSGTYTF